MIIEKTGWMGVTETSRNKNQKIANIDKLIEMARQYEQIGFKNIYDFIEQLKYVSENEIIESEAVAVTGENAVNIMTIQAAKGKATFEMICVACHQVNQRMIGPAMAGVYERRSPEWVMNMILNPDGMLKEDPIAQALLKEYNNMIMNNQNLSEDEARALAEYLRTL